MSAHIDTEHGIQQCRSAGPDLPTHQCPLCPFEDNVKSKVTRHMLSCQKRFVADRNLEPPIDWEPPAKIPRILPPPHPHPASAAAAAAAGRGLRAFTSGMNPAASAAYALATAKGLSALPYHPLLPKSALIHQQSMGYNNSSSSSANSSFLGKTGGSGGGKTGLGGLRLPAELHVVSGSGQTQRGNSLSGSMSVSAAKGRDFHHQHHHRQQSGANPSPSSYLNPSSSYNVPNNQIYQVFHNFLSFSPPKQNKF